MCDVKKYSEIYKEIIKLNPEDILQIVLESPTGEQKDFYEFAGNYLIQRKQEDAIARNVF